MHKLSYRAWLIVPVLAWCGAAGAEQADGSRGQDTMMVIEEGVSPEDIVGIIELPAPASARAARNESESGPPQVPGNGAPGRDAAEAARREAGQEVSEAARSNASEVADTARDNAGEMASEARERAGEVAEEARDAAAEIAEEARESAQETAEEMRESAEDMRDDLRDDAAPDDLPGRAGGPF